MENSEMWQAAAALGTWTIIVGGVLYLVVRLTVRTAIQEAFSAMNGTYVRTEGAHLTGAEIERRLEVVEGLRVARGA